MGRVETPSFMSTSNTILYLSYFCYTYFMQPRFKIALWILIFSLVFCKSFFGEHIISKALYDFDEARYAEVSKNILRTGKIDPSSAIGTAIMADDFAIL